MKKEGDMHYDRNEILVMSERKLTLLIKMPNGIY